VALLPADSHWWESTVGAHFATLDAQQLQQLGFEPEVADWRVERLSSGEKQRLALLRVLANRPQVLLLDEPTANLDSANTLRVEHLVKNYLQANQASCLWVSHDQAQIARLGARRLEMGSAGLREVA
jgi:ABC-type iron transport system FetAB ATPase subunit